MATGNCTETLWKEELSDNFGCNNIAKFKSVGEGPTSA